MNIKKKILIVDDEEDILKLLDTRLSSAGYSVIRAANGKEAIILAKKENPNLIILDVAMPGMNGGEAAEILKKDPTTKDIPVVFLTWLIKKDEESHKRIRGGKCFIAKPYDATELLEVVKENAR